MKIKCPKCKVTLKVPPDKGGVIVGCPKCRTRLKLPAYKAETEAPVLSDIPANIVRPPDPFDNLPEPMVAPPPVPPQPTKRKRRGIPWALVGLLGALAAVLLLSVGVWFFLFGESRQQGKERFSQGMQQLEFSPKEGSTHVYDVTLSTQSPKASYSFEIEYKVKEENDGGNKIAFTINKIGTNVPSTGDPFKFEIEDSETGEFVLLPSGVSQDLPETLKFPFWLGPVVRTPLLLFPNAKLGEWTNRFRMPVTVPDFTGYPTRKDANYESFYSVKDRNSNSVSIEEKRTIKPIFPDGSFAMSASTKYLFDKKLGMTSSCTTDGNMVIGEHENQRSVEFSVSCKRR